ncbi:MAG TPA: aspartate aminotransferase family protein [Acidobacteriota bacterium]|nr:aspartate aminotransferase family protein [Acidobacteriota bacterium]
MNETGASAVASASAERREAQQDYLFPCVSTYYAEPMVMAEAQGVWVKDVEGDEYLDLFAGILTTSVGHCNPDVTAATKAQIDKLGHTSTLYITDPQIDAARKLASIAPGALRKTFFTNSGTEAIETAIMLACMYTGRSEIMALRLAYSGRSILATNITAHAAWRPLASTLPVKHALAPYPYRCPFKSPCDDSCVDKFANDLEDAIVTTTGGKPAAFIAETILGVGGFIVPPPGYFQRAAEIIRSYGGVFICDEVQAGFGRTGDKWFGIEHWDVEPDIMVMAKGIANGQPVGATITRDEIADAWTAKTVSTYGGNPVSMAAMSATLDVMQREDVPANAAARGGELRAGFDALAERYPWIGEVRGMGLMQALELVEDRESKTPSPATASALLEAARAEGLLVGLGGQHGNVIRVGPSLLVTQDEIAEALSRLGRACERVDAGA